MILTGRKDKPSTSHHQKTVQQENLWKAHPWIQGGKKNKNHNFWNFAIQYTMNAAAHSTSKFDRVKFTTGYEITDSSFAYIEVHTMLKRPASCSF